MEIPASSFALTPKTDGGNLSSSIKDKVTEALDKTSSSSPPPPPPPAAESKPAAETAKPDNASSGQVMSSATADAVKNNFIATQALQSKDSKTDTSSNIASTTQARVDEVRQSLTDRLQLMNNPGNNGAPVATTGQTSSAPAPANTSVNKPASTSTEFTTMDGIPEGKPTTLPASGTGTTPPPPPVNGSNAPLPSPAASAPAPANPQPAQGTPPAKLPNPTTTDPTEPPLVPPATKPSTEPVKPTGQMETVGNKIIDANGKEFVPLGGNSVVADWVDDQGFKDMKASGANFTRLSETTATLTQPKLGDFLDKAKNNDIKVELAIRTGVKPDGSPLDPGTTAQPIEGAQLTDTKKFLLDSIKTIKDKGMEDDVMISLQNEAGDDDPSKFDKLTDTYKDLLRTGREEGGWKGIFVIEQSGWGQGHNSPMQQNRPTLLGTRAAELAKYDAQLLKGQSGDNGNLVFDMHAYHQNSAEDTKKGIADIDNNLKQAGIEAPKVIFEAGTDFKKDATQTAGQAAKDMIRDGTLSGFAFWDFAKNVSPEWSPLVKDMVNTAKAQGRI